MGGLVSRSRPVSSLRLTTDGDSTSLQCTYVLQVPGRKQVGGDIMLSIIYKLTSRRPFSTQNRVAALACLSNSELDARLLDRAR